MVTEEGNECPRWELIWIAVVVVVKPYWLESRPSVQISIPMCRQSISKSVTKCGQNCTQKCSKVDKCTKVYQKSIVKCGQCVDKSVPKVYQKCTKNA